MAISLRVKEEEADLIRDYARMNGQSVSEFIRSTVMERIEDEIRYVASEAYGLDQA